MQERRDLDQLNINHVTFIACHVVLNNLPNLWFSPRAPWPFVVVAVILSLVLVAISVAVAQ